MGNSDPVSCKHRMMIRLLGSDPRLWRCESSTVDPGIVGCSALLVEGRSWMGEPRWFTVPQPITCVRCNDGTCTSLDCDVCADCGSASRRPVVGPACDCDWPDIPSHREWCATNRAVGGAR